MNATKARAISNELLATKSHNLTMASFAIGRALENKLFGCTVEANLTTGEINQLTGNGFSVASCDYTTGRSGMAFLFDRDNGPTTPATSDLQSSSLSVELWAMPMDGALEGHQQVMFAMAQAGVSGRPPASYTLLRAHQPSLGIDTFTWWYGSRQAGGSLAISSDWIHLVVTVGSTNTSLYVNGSVASFAKATLPSYGSYPFQLGAALPASLGGSATIPFIGKMEGITFYNRELSGAEVSARLAGGSRPSGAVAEWSGNGVLLDSIGPHHLTWEPKKYRISW